jgi:PHAX RNA-binding domain
LFVLSAEQAVHKEMIVPHKRSAEQKKAFSDTINQIAAQLGETEHEPLRLIWCTVREFGIDEAQAVLAETLPIEERGGILTTDGSRRRTPGGVFIHLVLQRAHGATRHAIFYQKRSTGATNTETEDRLIVDGFAVYEPAIKGLAVLAQNVTTKHLQQAKWQAASAASENAEHSTQDAIDAG